LARLESRAEARISRKELVQRCTDSGNTDDSESVRAMSDEVEQIIGS
jgi:hypothetical protein